MGGKEYDLLTEINFCKMNFIAKSFDQKDWDFSGCKFSLNFAIKHKMQFRVHTLIWGSPDSHNPQFILDEKDPVILKKFMIDFITVMMQELGDYPIAWDIVNEAIDNKGSAIIK